MTGFPLEPSYINTLEHVYLHSNCSGSSICLIFCQLERVFGAHFIRQMGFRSISMGSGGDDRKIPGHRLQLMGVTRKEINRKIYGLLEQLTRAIKPMVRWE